MIIVYYTYIFTPYGNTISDKQRNTDIWLFRDVRML